MKNSLNEFNSRHWLVEALMGHNEMKIRREEKNIFKSFCILSQNLCVPSRKTLRSLIKHFTFSRKSLACNVVKCLCSLAEMWLLNKLSHSDTKLLRFPKKLCISLRKCVVSSWNFVLTSKSFAFSQKYCAQETLLRRSIVFTREALRSLALH